MNPERANQLSGAVWLIGIGVLFVTGYWWPGVMFVVGVGMIVQGLAEGRGWYAFQAAAWMIGLGLWFALGWGVGALLIVIGISALIAAFTRPPLGGKPKPVVDQSLE